MKIDGDTLLRRNDLPFRKLAEEAVVVNPRTREVHVLDEVGAHIWDLLAQEQTLADVVAALARAYEGDPATVRAEAAAFLSDLATKDLVRARPRGGPAGGDR